MSAASGGAVQTVRRVITYILLFVMIMLASIGLSGLLTRLLDLGNDIISDDSSGLAEALAFTLIAGPLAAVLWWLVWRGLSDERDRASVGWALYLVFASTVALVVAASSLLSAAASLVGGGWVTGEFATGLVWTAVWTWHRWMQSNRGKPPTRLIGAGSILGSFYGLAIGTGAGVSALAQLISSATDAATDIVAIGGDPWEGVVQFLIWAAGGTLIWWWHWIHDGAARLRSGFARVVLVIITGFGASALSLAGIGLTLYVLLRLGFDRDSSLAERLDPLGFGLATAVIGALVWVYHRRVLDTETSAVREATRLVTSGVSLAAAASGVGVIVNALLAALGRPLAEGNLTALLLGGLSALIVGGPAWWLFWRPQSQQSKPGASGRRTYLVAIFGISALVALITLILVAFRLFEFGLDDVSGESVLDRVRAPLGLLTATLLVAGYHFAVWRREAVDAPPRATLAQVVLVTGSDPEPLRRAIDERFAASVTVWKRADALDTAATPELVLDALADVGTRKVLVVLGADAHIQVVPLEG